ncbi:glycosyltransferase [Buttiauxella ferragutiae]|uniref:glycosyltransferase n=1 Tax=Buttiauxella ferragutiae TaxID=82989 RepID=UPI0035260903
MYNGINLEDFSFFASPRKAKNELLCVDDNTKIVLSIGRLTEAKDFQNLLISFSKFNNKEDVQLLIIGEGTLEYELKNLAIELKINNKIHCDQGGVG